MDIFQTLEKDKFLLFLKLICKDISVKRPLELYLIPDKFLSYLMASLKLRTEFLTRLMWFVATNADLTRRYWCSVIITATKKAPSRTWLIKKFDLRHPRWPMQSVFSIGNSQQPTLFFTSLYLVLRLERPVSVYIKTIIRLDFKPLTSELYLSKKGRPSLLQ
jgi:hypothetical protein